MSHLEHKNKNRTLMNRRNTPRVKDGLYKIIVLVNILAWCLLVAAFITLHYARPDFISGVQRFWGIPGNTDWSLEHVSTLFLLVKACLLLTLSTMLLKIRRTRRRSDNYGINLYLLVIIGLVTLLVLTLSFT